MSKYLTFSLCQPWASLCVAGATKYVRGIRPPIAGVLGTRIAIYAARRPAGRDHLDTKARDAVDQAFGRTDWPDDLPFGAIVGTVALRGAYHITAHDRRSLLATYDRVVGDVPRSHVERTLKVDLLGDYRPGLWAWLVEEPVAFIKAINAHAWRGWWMWHEPSAKDRTQLLQNSR
jgi:hypothetical protein